MNLWKKIKENSFSFDTSFIDPMIGKTVIRFTNHGCMGQIEKFDYIGKIVDSSFRSTHKFYKVEILKSGEGEKREGNLKQEYAFVPSWYLQNLGVDFYIAYD